MEGERLSFAKDSRIMGEEQKWTLKFLEDRILASSKNGVKWPWASHGNIKTLQLLGFSFPMDQTLNSSLSFLVSLTSFIIWVLGCRSQAISLFLHPATSFSCTTIPGMESFAETATSLRGLPQMVIESISRCDVDIRRELYSSILLSGGTASMQQLKERLEKDLLEESPQAARVKVLASGNATERRFRSNTHEKLAGDVPEGLILMEHQNILYIGICTTFDIKAALCKYSELTLTGRASGLAT
nr:actin-related protein 4-like [Ipomoea batatas]